MSKYRFFGVRISILQSKMKFDLLEANGGRWRLLEADTMNI